MNTKRSYCIIVVVGMKVPNGMNEMKGEFTYIGKTH